LRARGCLQKLNQTCRSVTLSIVQRCALVNVLVCGICVTPTLVIGCRPIEVEKSLNLTPLDSCISVDSLVGESNEVRIWGGLSQDFKTADGDLDLEILPLDVVDQGCCGINCFGQCFHIIRIGPFRRSFVKHRQSWVRVDVGPSVVLKRCCRWVISVDRISIQRTISEIIHQGFEGIVDGRVTLNPAIVWVKQVVIIRFVWVHRSVCSTDSQGPWKWKCRWSVNTWVFAVIDIHDATWNCSMALDRTGCVYCQLARGCKISCLIDSDWCMSIDERWSTIIVKKFIGG
jgi:hypothetical protein